MRTRRPCWIVLAPRPRLVVVGEIARQWAGHELDTLDVVGGEAGYVAVVERSPGSEGVGDEDLAVALSRGAERPAYVLWLDDDNPRVQAFVDGEYAGEVVAWPDDVAAQLGCEVPGLDPASGPVDLTPREPPTVDPGEPTVARLTLAQWRFQMALGSDWAVLLDGRDPTEVAAALDHDDAAIRALGCRLVEAMGPFGLGDLAPAVVRRLRELADGDPDGEVRAAARRAHEDLTDGAA